MAAANKPAMTATGPNALVGLAAKAPPPEELDRTAEVWERVLVAAVMRVVVGAALFEDEGGGSILVTVGPVSKETLVVVVVSVLLLLLLGAELVVVSEGSPVAVQPGDPGMQTLAPPLV